MDLGAGVVSVVVALAAVILILYVALRHGRFVSRLVWSKEADVLLLSVLGLTLLVAGLAAGANISSAVGAFLVGIAISGPAAKHAQRVLTPLRDLFAAVFFLFFGLSTDPPTSCRCWSRRSSSRSSRWRRKCSPGISPRGGQASPSPAAGAPGSR